jgi:hypothetical protein
VGVACKCSVRSHDRRLQRRQQMPPATSPALTPANAAYKCRVETRHLQSPPANVACKRHLQTPAANAAYKHRVQTCHLQMPLAHVACKRHLQTPPTNAASSVLLACTRRLQTPPTNAAYKRRVQTCHLQMPPAHVACKRRLQTPCADVPLANATCTRRLQTTPANAADDASVRRCDGDGVMRWRGGVARAVALRWRCGGEGATTRCVYLTALRHVDSSNSGMHRHARLPSLMPPLP